MDSTITPLWQSEILKYVLCMKKYLIMPRRGRVKAELQAHKSSDDVITELFIVCAGSRAVGRHPADPLHYRLPAENYRRGGYKAHHPEKGEHSSDRSLFQETLYRAKFHTALLPKF